MKCTVGVLFATIVTITARSIWRTELNATTYTGTGGGLYDPGYAASVGRMYVTTHVNQTMHVLDRTTGSVAWSYSKWPALSLKLAARCVITGDQTNLIVLRGLEIYSFHTATGLLQFERSLGSEAPSLSMLNNQLLLTFEDSFSVMDPNNGRVLWNITNVSGPIKSSPSGQFIAALIKESSGDVLTVFNRQGSVIFELPVLQSPYIFLLSDTAVTYFTTTGPNRVIQVQIHTGLQLFNRSIPHAVGGYGIGDGYFYFHFQDSLASFNTTTGELVGLSAPIRNISYIDHILGYSNLAVLGMTGPSNSLIVAGFAADDMQPLWSVQPARSKDLTVYGNWIGTLAVPSQHGLLLLDGRTGRVLMQNDSYSELQMQSVDVGPSSVVFSYGKTVECYSYRS